MEELKKAAAYEGAKYLAKRFKGKNNLVVLGSGSTVEYAFGPLSKHGMIATDTSSRTARLARDYGIKMAGLEEFTKLSRGHTVFAIDGADEILVEGGKIHMIKGGGGCHTKEKEAGKLADIYVAVADGSKLVDYLGQKSMLAVEIKPGIELQLREDIFEMGEGMGVKIGKMELRLKGEKIFITDYKGGNILDLQLVGKHETRRLMEFGRKLLGIDGVIEHGFFFDVATAAVIASESGTRVIERK